MYLSQGFNLMTNGINVMNASTTYKLQLIESCVYSLYNSLSLSNENNIEDFFIHKS